MTWKFWFDSREEIKDYLVFRKLPVRIWFPAIPAVLWAPADFRPGVGTPWLEAVLSHPLIKANVMPVHAMKAFKRSGGTDPLIHNL
jgi:hypothetical protein